jgi:hypothetical protein
MSTSSQMEATHRSNISLAEGARQAAQRAALNAYNGLASGWAAYNASIVLADLTYMKAVNTSAVANGLTGPTRTIHELSNGQSDS